jgi:hypothetical protein
MKLDDDELYEVFPTYLVGFLYDRGVLDAKTVEEFNDRSSLAVEPRYGEEMADEGFQRFQYMTVFLHRKLEAVLGQNSRHRHSANLEDIATSGGAWNSL